MHMRNNRVMHDNILLGSEFETAYFPLFCSPKFIYPSMLEIDHSSLRLTEKSPQKR